MLEKIWKCVTRASEGLGIKPVARVLVVRLSEQRMYFFKNGKCARVFEVSTSEREPSNVADSFGTPRGLHEICEKIGAGEPQGMVFKGRVATGKLFWEMADGSGRGNLITTRILRLRGLEPGVNAGGNVDTFGRMVYVHGTNCEERIGERQSHGCVLMRNAEIAELFEEVAEGDWVLVTD